VPTTFDNGQEETVFNNFDDLLIEVDSEDVSVSFTGGSITEISM
jgi:hypothetical protein